MLSIGFTGLVNHRFLGKGRIHLLPNAFRSEEELARTIFHEKIHLEQFIEFGEECVTENYEAFEKEARKLEELFWKERHQ